MNSSPPRTMDNDPETQNNVFVREMINPGNDSTRKVDHNW